MSEANKTIVRQIEEAWNTNQLDKLDPLFADNFRSYAVFPGMPPILASAKQAHQMAMQSFPDRKTEIQDLIGDGDQVAVRIRMTGTNTGGLPAFNLPANGNKVDIEWVSIYRLEGGKVIEHRAVMDLMGLMQQLGAMPASQSAAGAP